MTAPEGLVAVILAAGLSRRFGGDKLLAPFNGKPLATHAADRIAELGIRRRLAVCPTGRAERAALFTHRGFEIVWNDAPENGIGHSLALAAVRAQGLDAEALLVCLADMPGVTAEHLGRLVAAGQRGEGAVATEADGVRMPPALFPRSMLADLAVLTGDRGARALLADARAVEANSALARDLDRRADFG